MTIANMHPERWRLIDELFHTAIELAPRERVAYLESACGGDVSLRAEIEKLIEGFNRAGNFIESHRRSRNPQYRLPDLKHTRWPGSASAHIE